MKQCNTCHKTLDFSNFYTSKGKYFNRCKQCVLDIYHKRKPPPQPRPAVRKSREHVRALQTAYKRRRRQSDSLFKLRSNIGTAIANVLSAKGYKKTSSTAEILGCSFDQFQTHIEQQFMEGMSWNNRHLWHIDHIIPVRFAQTEQELLLLNHYTNLRPLWGTLNQNKAGMLTNDSINHPLYKQITENRICG